MAMEGNKFPPQKQESQPGKEHLMSPIPESINPDYQPSNKLLVMTSSVPILRKVALITGGDSGIGRAVCYLFAKEGATVAFTYVKDQEEQDAHDTLQKIKELKATDVKDPVAIPADLGYNENCKRVVEEVVKNYGKINILVNNAAESRVGTIDEITEDQLLRIFRTNIFAYFFMARHSLKHLAEGASIINTTSVQAYLGSPSSLEYQSTKGAIVAFTRGLALQLVDRGIRVNGVAPGPVWTPVQVVIHDKYKVQSLGSETPMGRAGQPDEIAPCYVFLASRDSSYYTGQVE
ncbi:UNVERIFIED_CONTAM: Glucose and ribitol dehydrogenase [Sesamum latifolium]|uniref:Glucose and ribitol dehydrogenase n=1 Tax=Sesamum latifolium TaxID=2727402 RepID=A0AAW2XT69_9LAMI